jgi:hypothetical protein
MTACGFCLLLDESFGTFFIGGDAMSLYATSKSAIRRLEFFFFKNELMQRRGSFRERKTGGVRRLSFIGCRYPVRLRVILKDLDNFDPVFKHTGRKSV